MPAVSRFFGITISMYFQDHAPPHFHARYGECEAALSVQSARVLKGHLPRRAAALVREWLRCIARSWRWTGRALRNGSLCSRSHRWSRLEAMERLLRIAEVRVLRDRRVELTLTDGSRKTVDLGRYLSGPVFEQIAADDDVFARVRVDPELGTIVWPNGADLCPDVLIYDLPPAS